MEPKQILNLVRLMQSGDHSAFAALYDEFADRIYTFIRYKVGSEEEAEDILQEVFIKAWRGAARLRLEDLNFSAWLYKIAANTTTDHHRSLFRAPPPTSLDPTMDIEDPSDTAQSTDAWFRETEVRQSLQKLPPQYKEIIELRFFQDLSITEVATILRKSQVSIRVLQYRALRKLEEIYTRNEPTQ